MSELLSRSREDFTKELSAYQRRLDSLAQLLAARSECVAVCIVNQELYIAANEFFIGSKTDNKGNANYAAIEEIMKYFQTLVRSKNQDNELRKNIFQTICSSARFKEASPGDAFVKKIADDVLEGKDLTISDIHNKYGKNSSIAAKMYGEFVKLRKSFLKLEESCISPDPELKPLQASLSKDFKILKEENSTGVHAEVQILATVINLIEHKNYCTDDPKKGEKIYIGISRLCCLHCRCMLETANEELKERHISTNFSFRGKHDLDFVGNWKSPSIFEQGYNSVRESSHPSRKGDEDQLQATLASSIGKKAKETILQYLQKDKPVGISMEGSESDSEAEIDNININKQKSLLEQHLRLMQDMQKTEDFASGMRLISIALCMHNNDSFRQLYKLGQDLPVEEKTRYLNAIVENLNNSKDFSDSQKTITLAELVKIIKKPNLVGDRLAREFQEYNPPSLLAQEGLIGEKTQADTVAQRMSSFDRSPPDAFGLSNINSSLDATRAIATDDDVYDGGHHDDNKKSNSGEDLTRKVEGSSEYESKPKKTKVNLPKNNT